MRLMTRNKQPIWYANYSSTSIVYDEYGNESGAEIGYSAPVKAYWNVSVVDSDAEVQMFGVSAVDMISVVAEKSGFPLTETSVLWFGVEPALKTDGSTDTAFNYRVIGIRPSLNELRFYAQKVSVTQVVAPAEVPPAEGGGE